MVTRWSGIQTGALSPGPARASGLPSPAPPSRELNVAFRLRYSSIAEFRASSQSFRSCTDLEQSAVQCDMTV